MGYLLGMTNTVSGKINMNITFLLESMKNCKVPCYYDSDRDPVNYHKFFNGITKNNLNAWIAQYNEFNVESITIENVIRTRILAGTDNNLQTESYVIDNGPFIYPLHVSFRQKHESRFINKFEHYNGYFEEYVKFDNSLLNLINSKKGMILLYNSWEGWNEEFWCSIIDTLIKKHPTLDYDNFIVSCGNLNLSTSRNFSFIFSSLCQLSKDKGIGDQCIRNIENAVSREHKFVCLNRRPRIHRYIVLSELFGYRNKGLLSFLGDVIPKQTHLDENPEKAKSEYRNLIKTKLQQKGSSAHQSLNSFKSKCNKTDSMRKFIEQDIESFIPLLVHENIDLRENPVPDPDHEKYMNSYLHIVTETEFQNQRDITFISEKTWKPMFYLQPFVVLSTKGFLQNLHALGVQTFDKWIDESYDEIDDDYDRCIAALSSAISFFEQDTDVLDRVMKEMLLTLKHNHTLVNNLPKREQQNFILQLINIFHNSNEVVLGE